MGSIATLRDLTEALIQSARQEGKLDKVTSDMEGFFSLVSDNEEVRKILCSSTFRLPERTGITADVCRRQGYDSLVLNFLTLALELNKFKALILSERTFIHKLIKASGRLRAEVVTATQASEEDLSDIKEKLTQVMGRNVEIESRVAPDIIGGVIVKVEDKVFDGSIKFQLERIRSVLSQS